MEGSSSAGNGLGEGRTPVPRRRRWLSDRAVLKGALWLIALVVAWQGVGLAMAGATMTYEKEPARFTEPDCGAGEAPADGEPPAEAETTTLVDGPCVMFQTKPAVVGHTAQGWAYQVTGLVLVLAAVGLLLYQALRWNPSSVGSWLAPPPPKPPRPAPPEDEGLPGFMPDEP